MTPSEEHKTHHRILVISPLYPPHIGGLESHASQWNEHMSRTGYDITVFTPQTSSGGESHEFVSNVEIYRFPAFEIVANYPVPKLWNVTFWRSLKRALTNRPTIVISRTRFFLTSPMAYLIARRNHIPWMHIEHGSDHVRLNNKLLMLLARLYDYTLGIFIFRQADVVLANSKASAAFVTKISGRNNISVIYRGVDHEKIEKTLVDKNIKQRYSNKTIITFIGRLIDGKGTSDMLKACRNLQFPASNFQFLIVGDGPQRHNLEKLSKKLGINKNVTFMGELSFERTTSVLKATDIFINPSYTEGLPTSVIEAALCKCAIIATPVGGTREIVSPPKSAVFFTPGDTRQLANSIEQLIGNELKRSTLATNAHEEVKKKFSWDDAVLKYKKVILHI